MSDEKSIGEQRAAIWCLPLLVRIKIELEETAGYEHFNEHVLSDVTWFLPEARKEVYSESILNI